MDLTEKLRLWGATRAAAQDAERAAAKAGEEGDRSKRDAEVLRQRADRLHGEIYSELGGRRSPAQRR